MIHVSYNKLFKELENIIKINVGQAVLDQNILPSLIDNLKTAWPTAILISMPFLNSLDNLS